MNQQSNEEKKPISSKEQDKFFERLNEKYNRLWEQETQIGVLIIGIIAGFSFSILAFDTRLPGADTRLSWGVRIAISILMLLTIAIGRLDFERTETKKWLGIFVETDLED